MDEVCVGRGFKKLFESGSELLKGGRYIIILVQYGEVSIVAPILNEVSIVIHHILGVIVDIVL